MSHYAVAVFSDDGDFGYLLEPYNEADERYFEFCPVDREEKRRYFEEKFKPQNPDWTFEQFCENFGYIYNANGEFGYAHNPHGYWDWYSLDGKEYMYELRIDASDDEYHRKNDYDYDYIDPEDVKRAEEFWDSYVVRGKKPNHFVLYKPEYYLERYKTKEQYVREIGVVVPFAFITPDGAWHAPGRMGWFAQDDATDESMNAYIKEWQDYIHSDSNPYVSFVDCHI